MDAIDERTVVSLRELCEWLGGETPQRLELFVEAGILSRDERGEFRLMASIAAYFGYWQGVVASRSSQT